MGWRLRRSGVVGCGGEGAEGLGLSFSTKWAGGGQRALNRPAMHFGFDKELRLHCELESREEAEQIQRDYVGGHCFPAAQARAPG